MSNKSAKVKKLRRKENLEASIKDENIEFDVISILRDSPLETKPEIGDFLKKYVKNIRVFVEHSKMTIYPVRSCSIAKVFVDFLDGHQIIMDINKSPREYTLWKGLDEISLKEKEFHYLVGFMQKLQEFSFVHE